MDSLYKRDLLSYNIDNKIKYLCSEEEKLALNTLLKSLQLLVKEKSLLDHQIQDIKNEIDKILLYNI